MNKNDTRQIFENFRRALKESEENTPSQKQNGVPYTQQDELLQTSMQIAKEQFGADFSKIKTPMFYYKEDDDVTFSGEIPSLNNSKFQFSFKGYPSGCYFWSSKDAMILNDEVIKTLSRLYGVYKNWQKDLSTAEDRRPMNLRNED